jgi:hypothetical protein
MAGKTDTSGDPLPGVTTTPGNLEHPHRKSPSHGRSAPLS